MSKEKARPSAAKAGAKPPAGKKVRTSRGVSPHQTAALATELSRNALSRERYEFLLRVTFGLVIVLLVSVLTNVYLGTRPTEYRYFAADPQGSIREIEVLKRPVQSDQLVLNWVTAAVTEAYSMSFANHAQQLEDIRLHFTEAGWRGYEQALDRSGFIISLLNNQLVTTAVPRGAPVIVAQGVAGNVYGWRVQVPLLVTFKSASVNRSQDLMVEVTVVRRPAHENPVGLGIAQIMSN
jgi:intracellular multiplication protein IcmL